MRISNLQIQQRSTWKCAALPHQNPTDSTETMFGSTGLFACVFFEGQTWNKAQIAQTNTEGMFMAQHGRKHIRQYNKILSWLVVFTHFFWEWKYFYWSWQLFSSLSPSLHQSKYVGKHTETVEDAKVLPTYGEAGKLLFVLYCSHNKLKF